MGGVTPDWIKEQQRVNALLGNQANVGQDYINQYGPYQAQTDVQWGGPTGAQAPGIDPNTGLFKDTYGYFDQGKIQSITQHSNAMQEALNRGDPAGYKSALEAYKTTTGGLQPVWSYNINPQTLAGNAPHANNPWNEAYNRANPGANTGVTPQNKGLTYPTKVLGGQTQTPPGNTDPGGRNPINPINPPPPPPGGTTPPPGGTTPPPGGRTPPPGGRGPGPFDPPGTITGTLPPHDPGNPVGDIGDPISTHPGYGYGELPLDPARTTRAGNSIVGRGYGPGTFPEGPTNPAEGTAAGFANFGYDLSAINSSDPKDILRTSRNYAMQMGNAMLREQGQLASTQNMRARKLADLGDTYYADLLEHPGYDPRDEALIRNERGLEGMQLTDAEARENFLRNNEQQDIAGDPYLASRGYQTEIGGAIDRGKLGLSQDYNTRFDFSPQDEQDMINQAGRQVGLSATAQKEDLIRRNMAQGNTNALGLAAAQNRIQRTGDVGAADAMLNAKIAAKQFGLGVTGQKEQTRLGAEQDISNRMIGAAGTQAGLRGQGEASASQRAQWMAQDRQQANQANQATDLARKQYADTARSQRSTQAADTARADQQAARLDIRREQNQATNTELQNRAAGLQTFGNITGANTASQAGAMSAAQIPSTTEKLLTGLTQSFAEGGVADKPTLARVGEAGPEMIVPVDQNGLPQYRPTSYNLGGLGGGVSGAGGDERALAMQRRLGEDRQRALLRGQGIMNPDPMAFAPSGPVMTGTPPNPRSFGGVMDSLTNTGAPPPQQQPSMAYRSGGASMAAGDDRALAMQRLGEDRQRAMLQGQGIMNPEEMLPGIQPSPQSDLMDRAMQTQRQGLEQGQREAYQRGNELMRQGDQRFQGLQQPPPQMAPQGDMLPPPQNDMRQMADQAMRDQRQGYADAARSQRQAYEQGQRQLEQPQTPPNPRSFSGVMDSIGAPPVTPQAPQAPQPQMDYLTQHRQQAAQQNALEQAQQSQQQATQRGNELLRQGNQRFQQLQAPNAPNPNAATPGVAPSPQANQRAQAMAMNRQQVNQQQALAQAQAPKPPKAGAQPTTQQPAAPQTQAPAAAPMTETAVPRPSLSQQQPAQGKAPTAPVTPGGGLGMNYGQPQRVSGLAAGGMVQRPTLARLGEEGPEMVMPLLDQDTVLPPENARRYGPTGYPAPDTGTPQGAAALAAQADSGGGRGGGTQPPTIIEPPGTQPPPAQPPPERPPPVIPPPPVEDEEPVEKEPPEIIKEPPVVGPGPEVPGPELPPPLKPEIPPPPPVRPYPGREPGFQGTGRVREYGDIIDDPLRGVGSTKGQRPSMGTYWGSNKFGAGNNPETIMPPEIPPEIIKPPELPPEIPNITGTFEGGGGPGGDPNNPFGTAEGGYGAGYNQVANNQYPIYNTGGAGNPSSVDDYWKSLQPDVTTKINYNFARGGMVNRPTVARLGESGPEAVVPLGRRSMSYRRRGEYAGR